MKIKTNKGYSYNVAYKEGLFIDEPRRAVRVYIQFADGPWSGPMALIEKGQAVINFTVDRPCMRDVPVAKATITKAQYEALGGADHLKELVEREAHKGDLGDFYHDPGYFE